MIIWTEKWVVSLMDDQVALACSAASISFEIWGSWDPGPKIRCYSGKFQKKIRFLMAISQRSIRFSRQEFPMTFLASNMSVYQTKYAVYSYNYANYSISLSKVTFSHHTLYCA